MDDIMEFIAPIAGLILYFLFSGKKKKPLKSKRKVVSRPQHTAKQITINEEKKASKPLQKSDPWKNPLDEILEQFEESTKTFNKSFETKKQVFEKKKEVFSKNEKIKPVKNAIVLEKEVKKPVKKVKSKTRKKKKSSVLSFLHTKDYAGAFAAKEVFEKKF